MRWSSSAGSVQAVEADKFNHRVAVAECAFLIRPRGDRAATTLEGSSRKKMIMTLQADDKLLSLTTNSPAALKSREGLSPIKRSRLSPSPQTSP
jgi:hypothetical protein